MQDDRILVPRHEPQVIEAMARLAFGGVADKVPTTSLRHLVVDGILLRSRYRKADELAMLADMADMIPGIFGKDIEEIICDSRQGSSFVVYLREWSLDLAVEVAEVVEAACVTLIGGHNGISVFPSKSLGVPDSFEIAPGWVHGSG